MAKRSYSINPPNPHGRLLRDWTRDLTSWLQRYVDWASKQGEEHRGLILVQSPEGGIAAGATGTCTEYGDDDATLLSGVTLTAKNPYTGEAVPAEVKTWVTWRRGEWKVVNWECEPPEEEG